MEYHSFEWAGMETEFRSLRGRSHCSKSLHAAGPYSPLPACVHLMLTGRVLDGGQYIGCSLCRLGYRQIQSSVPVQEGHC